MTFCRASLSARDADGELLGSWDSPLPDDADNHADLLTAADDVRLFLTVERGPVGAAAALTIPAELITSLAKVGGYLWIDAYQNADEG